MKDIVLWESKTARESEEQRLRELALLHQSGAPPSELLLPVPRKLHWKKSLRFVVAFEAVILAIVICSTIWLGAKVTELYREVAHDARNARERLRHKASETTDPDRKAEIEKAIREGEEFDRKWLRALGWVLACACIIALLFPTAHVVLNWCIHIRPNLLLLRDGTPVRATVIERRNRFALLPAIEFAFMSDRGEPIHRTQLVSRSESRLFNVGDSVWVLYLPRRPKLAGIYGLKSALADIVAA